MTMVNTAGAQVSTPSDREIRITRAFNAPARMVWDAYTKPELVQRWLGTIPGWSWVECEMDVRVGGRYRWVWKGPDGMQMGMGGVYREIVARERLVNTEKFDQAWYAGEAIDTAVFTEASGKTTVTTTILYESKSVRDSVLASPMASGMEQGYKMLDQLLAESI
jgi:uncharacterized protein YndB with AHSA1/START domain